MAYPMNWLYRRLRRVRPAQVTVLVKGLLGIKRRSADTQSGHWFWIDPISQFGGSVLEARTYEPALTQLLGAILRRDDLFIDVGANEGYFSVMGSSLVGPNGRVLAIEPQSRLTPIIYRNLEIN